MIAGPGLQPDMKLQDKVLEYLQTCNVLTLATNGVDGLWAAAVFYVNKDFTLYFLSNPATRHALNIIDNPQVAGTIHEDYKDWKKIKGIQLEGVVHKISGSKKADAIAHYIGKFPLIGKQTPTEIGEALHRVSWYALTPSLLYFIDNSIGLGHRDRVDLKKD